MTSSRSSESSSLEKWAPLAVSALTGAGATMWLVLYQRYVFTRSSSSSEEPSAHEKKIINNNNENKVGELQFPSPVSVLTLIQQRRSIFPKQFSTTKKVPRTVLEKMLEGARWAPTHHVTEPWKFVVFESLQSRSQLGLFLAEQYKKKCQSAGKKFLQAKFDKKIANATKSSFVVALLCTTNSNSNKSQNPVVEEICSVAMAIQNMHLIATAHQVGAYWSTGGVYGKQELASPSTIISNPASTRDFLQLKDEEICMGWMFVGDYFGEEKNESTKSASSNSSSKQKSWPVGRRKDLMLEGRLAWR